MTEQLYLLQKHFDTALESPDGIKKLRELILTIAMQGKLVKQDPKDQPASELLKEIEAEKERLVKEGKIKKQKELPPIKPDEVPYEVPEGWAWTRLGEIGFYNGRDIAKPNEIKKDIWVLDLEDIEKDTSRIIYRAKYSERQSKSNKSYFYKDDVLYGKLRPYLNKVVVADSDGVCTTEIVPIVPSLAIETEYLLWLLKRPDFILHVNTLSYGVKMPRLGTDDAISSLHPLPPLAEQKRIVAKIDELMALCDRLEAQRKARNGKRRAVHTAAINGLLTAADKKEFDTSWQFITRHFDPLYSVKENVAELKKAILTLAMQGKLVKQNPKDQPASELLKEIQAEKERLIKEGKIKKQKELPPIKPEEVPYEVPEGWIWTRLGEIGEINPRNNFDDNQDAGFVPMPKIFAEYGLKHSFEVKKWAEIKKGYTHFADGDIGLAKITPCFENGKSCVFDGLPNKIGAGTTELHIFRNTYSAIYPYFLLLYIKNPRYISEGQTKMTGSAGQKRVPSDYFANNLFPLPPLTEQKRIVAKIDQLMALCDRLGNQIDQATAKQTDLFDAVLANV